MIVFLIGMCAIVCAQEALEPRLQLREGTHEASETPMRHGFFRVYEDRDAQSGRVLELDVVVLPALESPGEPDPRDGGGSP